MRNLFLVAISGLTFSLNAQKCQDCQALYDEGNYKEVISKVAQVADKAAMSDLVLLAKSYQNLGMKKDAVGAYSHILLNDENNVDALVSVGALFIEMEQYDNAMFSTERALKFDSKNHFAQYNKAVVYFYKKEKKNLNEYTDKLLKENPQNVDILYVKAMSYLDADDFEQAINTFKAIESIDENFPHVHFYHAYSLYKLDELDQAKEKFLKALKTDEDTQVDSYYYLAHLYIKQENKVDACEAYTNAINLGDITLTKEADDYCLAKKAKKFKLMDRSVRISF